MNGEKRIFGIGTVVVDHVVTLPKYPDRDTKCAVESQWRQIGGPVPVALSVAAHYGVRSYFAGRWGNDAAGHEVRNGLLKRGIDLTPSESNDDWSTGFAQVWTEQELGTRTIAFSRGDFPMPKLNSIEPHFGLLDECEILHLDGSSPTISLAAAERTRQSGGLVVLDAGSKKPRMEELLPLVDLIIASNLFCQSWFRREATTEEILAMGPTAVVRTHGEHGATYSNIDQQLRAPALDIKPVDTNGAGDIFCGAFLFGLINNWDIGRTLEFACFVAGNSCCHRGNSTWPEISEFEEPV